MANSRNDGKFEIKVLPMIGSYNKQRFAQFSPEDNASWYIKKGENTKKPYCMYPVLGRAHINYLGLNQLVFGAEARGIFKSIDFMYIVVGNSVYRIDVNYNQIDISSTPTGQVLQTLNGPIYFSFLVVNSIVYACFVDSQFIYIYQEGSGILNKITDINAPGIFTMNGNITKPGYIATFGNRIVVSVAGSSQFVLSAINLAGKGSSPPAGLSFDPSKCFTNFTTPQVFAQEDGIIRQFAVLNNTLYIFTDYVTGVWSNISAVFSGTGITFPWKKSSTYNWNFGLANSSSLDIDFGMLVFLARK